jgi:hypothetical protein
MILTQEHKEIKRTVRNFVENEINPYVDQWEKDGIFHTQTQGLISFSTKLRTVLFISLCS